MGSFYFFLRLAGKIQIKDGVKKSQTRPVENEKKNYGRGDDQCSSLYGQSENKANSVQLGWSWD